jgi:hypothetical protein
MLSNPAPLTYKNPSSSPGQGQVKPIVDKSGRFNQLQRSFQKQLMALAQEFYQRYQEPLILTDTVRTTAEQAKAHQEKPALALPAGHPNAMHPRGLAADVDSSQSRMLTPAMLAKAGLHLPALYKGETWHLEPVGLSNKDSGSSSNYYSLYKPQASFREQPTIVKSAKQTQPPERLSCLLPSGSAQRDPTPDRGLVQAAVEIESIFIEQLLGQMRGAMVDPVRTNPKRLRGYLSMADQHLARSLAAGGGLGLAQRIVEDLASLSPPPQTESRGHDNAPVPGKTGTATTDHLV